MQGLLLLAGLFSIASLPFAIAYDLMPPALIPLQIPLALIGIFGTTGPVSFLVLGPSRSETSETCGRLVSGFSLLRAGAAVDPLALGAFLDHQLGPSGNLWMGPGGRSWQDKLAELVRDVPLVIFDGRVISDSTRWEFFHLLTSGHLEKVIVVGPVGERGLATFLHSAGIVPVIELDSLCLVVKAAATRKKLLSWYSRRRPTILGALQQVQTQPVPSPDMEHPHTWSYLARFYDHLPQVIAMYDAAESGERREQSRH